MKLWDISLVFSPATSELNDRPVVGGHMGPPLQEVMDWYKTMTTNEYIRGVKAGIFPPFQKKIWQRGYYDHIIRNERDYLNIWTYIDQNPARWGGDEYFGGTP